MTKKEKVIKVKMTRKKNKKIIKVKITKNFFQKSIKTLKFQRLMFKY